jgi:predicted enzyme related to lactoylglutathione lyase
MSKHAIVHIEIPGKDPKKNSQFYRDLLGWEITIFEQLDYAMFNPGDGPGGGFATDDGGLNKVGSVLVYIDTDDIERDLKKAVELGGKIVHEKTEIPGQGWFGAFTDPEGNTLALYTSANPQQ